MVTYIRSDLEFILEQIRIAERHAAGEDLNSLLPNAVVPFGLRTVDGSFNNVFFGQSEFGAADNFFPRITTADPTFLPAYLATSGLVFDSQPRTISNLIVDQTETNPAAVAANGGNPTVMSPGLDGIFGTGDDTPVFFIPNTAPDEGLSASFNTWMTFFGQFFDHGLDLLTKGGSGTVFIQLQPDDPLYVVGSPTNFMVLTRATNQPGVDGILGTADDVREHSNTTSSFVDQNQTYSSHPSHQVFLRAYELVGGKPVATGELITNRNLGPDGFYGTADDSPIGGMATWAVVKAQARDILGINLTDADVFKIPLLATDAYGNFLKGVNGFPQVVIRTGNGLDGIVGTGDDTTTLVEGNPLVPVDLTNAVRTGHAFLDDVAHSAAPGTFDHDANPGTPKIPQLADVDVLVGDDGLAGTYDNELLDAHYIAGDGRVNENIGLTTVHHVFHSEHNRLVEQTKQVALATGDLVFLSEWLMPGTAPATFPDTQLELDALQWNGERLFQSAKFGTEMQYQHLVFEEFARKVQPNVDVFLAPEGYDVTIDASIVAEFAHTVYRFGHSLLTETIDRLDPNFVNSEIGLIEAFLNPLAFADSGATPDEAAGAIIRGMTRQAGNEIDEFVTEALRNSLLGLPLDLAAINLARGRDTGVPTLNAARRDFYQQTSDSQLKPYISWADLVQNLKHPESLINFIAAYGTHTLITAETTLEGKRAAATAIVFGTSQDVFGGDLVVDYTIAPPADRLDFLNSTGDYANLASGVTTTGVDAIDLWIGGLAEKQMPFGGLLGSTFNFVFETQLEALQNGDRFYYLSRTAGMNFGNELENNSFAKLIMRNTDVTHLPGDVFSTPAYILEVDRSKQFNASVNDPGPDGILGDNPLTVGVNESLDDNKADPVNDDPLALTALVIRDNPLTDGLDTNYLQYTGGDHVVLGGTNPGNLANPSGNDILIASIGDDTLWGDGGNDQLEGGAGNDKIEGGDGDDIITDSGGDDILKGNDGNDVISGGNGLNVLFGGAGSDFIITGEDVSTTFGGTGNDFILGTQMNLPTLGNEGDDWIEIGTQDGAGGDNFDPLAASTVLGHDVFITGGGFDSADGEGGDDIMLFSDGEDHFDGGGGFDWASYATDPFGVTANLLVNDLIEPPVTPSSFGVLDRFVGVEGLSGSAFSDVLRGDDADITQLATNDALNGELTRVTLIDNLQQLLDDALGAGTPSFSTGNIILGGNGSDVIEGRGGDDIIDGDSALNVKIAVHTNLDGTGPVIKHVSSLTELIPEMLSGAINPGQLKIVREIVSGDGGFNFDTAVFSGNFSDYNVLVDDRGTAATDDDLVTVADTVAGRDGVDRLLNIERLQFADQSIVLVSGLNEEPVGVLTLNDTTPAVNQTISASALGITDADNAGGLITGRPISYIWQVETIAGSGVFTDIVGLAGGLPATASGNSFRVTADLNGLALRARASYQDDNGVIENVFSAATSAVAGTVVLPPPAVIPVESAVVSPGGGVHLIRADLQFILDQIIIAERNAGGEALVDLVPNTRLPFGLRTVDGSFNNLTPGQEQFGTADNVFPRLVDPNFIGADPVPPGFGPPGPPVPTSYAQTSGFVFDSAPRTISNLIVDQTANNPAAVAANGGAPTVFSPGLDGIFGTSDDTEVFFIPNVTPDEGLSAPFNTWMTFFGQFFDHGLDLLTKGGSGTVFIPLQPDDPLFDPTPGAPNFMVVTRATNQPGFDGILGTADDVHEHQNTTSPFVDQNQTYSSHPSHQVFLRAYEFNLAGDPVATGGLITNRDLGPLGIFGDFDDVELGGMATWAVVKAQARDILGIDLTDANLFDVPLLATDAYGNFIRGLNGFVQVVFPGNVLMEGNPAAPLSLVGAVGTGHAFLNDIAHSANPGTFDHDGNPATPKIPQVADADFVVGDDGLAGTYDNELLDAHYIAGDGRVNENIGLTTVHHIFHSEHNRLVQHTIDVILASNDPAFIAQWQMPDGSWNGERLFQAAKFATEMQYQHLVFEEFARRVQPQVDVFLLEGQGYDTTIDPSIVAEFAHTVYRFGHSMLTETIDRLDANFVNSEIGLIAAFLNPLEFATSGATPDEAAGAIIRGTTRQVGNEIDEFVTEALRNSLVGLPLDLAAINIARGRDTGVPTLNAARRDFFDATGDTQLKPYSSWADLVQNLKHPESLVNFIAAYGTHAALTATDVNTLAEMRAVAMALVFGGDAIINEGALDERTFTADDPDRLQFLNSQGIYANTAAGVTTTGVDAIDLWIGGLAEKQMPFGGLLGSTFNFVFENQMEKLQNGDRFYYLERTAALNFLTELENNSFAKLIMANTDATHLPGDVFSTPAYILEVDQALQFNASVMAPGLDGILGDDPSTLVDESLDDFSAPNNDPFGLNDNGVPLVIRDNPLTPDPDTNYLQYTGVDHVVLGGTELDDIMIASIGDDTLYGDAGNDRLEGGAGVDMILGGTGDDIITDNGGDDNLQGGDGNDAIHGGNGINLILGGFGNDFIVTGEDSNESFGGPGNDFFLGTRGDEAVFGNEGDDWIERGMADGSAGESFDTRGLDSIIGHDVFIGDTVADRMFGEGGDDIMAGNGGTGDRYLGASGFDWAVFKHDTNAANVDLNLRAFNEAIVPLSTVSVLARYESVEGVSGSKFSDILRGDDLDAAGIAVSGFTGSVLTNISLIDGLQELLDNSLGGPVTSFGAGNIMLGGDGSDLMEGRGGDDIMDGDASLNVRISVREFSDGTGIEIDSANSMTELVSRVFSGEINPGQLVIVREILGGTPDAFNFDTALYTGNRDDYIISIDDNGTVGVFADDIVTVTDTVAARDGTDVLTHFERLQFADQTFTLVPFLNSNPEGALAILDDTSGLPDSTPTEGQSLRVSMAGVTDADNFAWLGAITGPVEYTWQFEARAGEFEDIVVATALGDLQLTGETIVVTPDLSGLVLRVRATYQDAHGVIEQSFSAPTAAVININDAPVGSLLISDTTPQEDQILSALNAFTDADGLTLAMFDYQWEQSVDGLTWDPISLGILQTFMPDQGQVGNLLRVTVSYTDDQGTTESLTSLPTSAVANLNDLPFGGVDLSNPLPVEGQAVTATPNFFDEDGANTPGFTYQWQTSPDGLVWTNILGATSDTFTPLQAQGNLVLRVVVNYTDDFGTVETLFSDATAPVELVNVLPVGTVDVSDLSPTETLPVTAVLNFTDGDGLPATFNYQWQAFNGTIWVNVGTNSASFTPTQTEVNQPLRVTVSYTDLGGTLETVTSAQTIVTGDFIAANGAAQTLNGTAGQDIIDGGAGADTLNGLDEDDILSGGDGDDIVNGGGGNDIINFTTGHETDTTDGGTGTDTMNLLGTATDNTMRVLYNGTVITAVAGGSVVNVETFNANLGANGAGGDTLSYDPLGAAVTTVGITVDLAAGTASGFDSVAGVENVTGGDGADSFAGDINNNTFIGGAGVDTYTLAGTTAAAVVTTGSATSAQAGTDTLSSIQNYIGSQGNDSIIVNGGVNVVDGQGGADFLDGGANNDTILGGAGNDTIRYIAGSGADTVDGGADFDTLAIVGTAAANSVTVAYNGSVITSVALGAVTNVEAFTIDLLGAIDTLSYGTTTAGVTVNLATGIGSGFTSIAGVENVNGGSGADSFTSGIGANTFFGNNGADTFFATIGDGNDNFDGGGGADTYNLSATTAGAIVTTTAAASAQTGIDSHNVENIIGSQGNDTITLNPGANVVDGQGGADTINTGAGSDTITGGAGNDIMNGGSQNDTFIFATAFGDDTISGFDALAPGGQDRLFLDSSLGINAGNFAASVTIAASGGGTLVSIGTESILLLGVAAANVDINDFQFGP